MIAIRLKYLFNNALLISYCLAILTLLMIGNSFYDERLYLGFGFLSVNLFVLLHVVVFIIKNIDYVKFDYIVLYLTPFLIGIVYLFNSLHFEYGVYKLGNFIFTMLFLLAAFSVLINKSEIEVFIKVTIYFLFVLLIATIFYKWVFGFFDRQVRFLFNGPIVFARLMGIAFFLSIFKMRGIIRVLFAALFFVAIFWTQSKGPILGVLFTIGLILLIRASILQRLLAFFIFFCAVILFVINMESLKEVEELSRFFLVLEALDGNVGGQNYGSIGSRIDAFSATIISIAAYPLGIGVGSWESMHQGFEFSYPHNIFLELTSEFGIVLGALMLVPALCMLKPKNNIFFFIWLFFLISHMVSGDLLDARFLFVFAFLNISYIPFKSRNDNEIH